MAVRTGTMEDGAAGISLMIVDPRSPGYATPRALAKMGWWCSDTAELALDAVRIEDRDVLGEGMGFASLARHFVSERISLAVTAYSTAQRALDITVEEVTLVAIRQALWVKRTDDYGQCYGSGFRGLLYPDLESGSGSRGLKKI